MPFLRVALTLAAALTILLSPSIRGTALRWLMYKNRPQTPPGHKPRYRHWQNGIEL